MILGNNPTFSGCTNIKRVIYEEGVTQVLGVGCKYATTISFPSTTISIGDSAFWGYNQLTSVSIPSSVVEIGRYAFDACTSLTSFTIGKSVENIGILAFRNCTGLEEIRVKSSNFMVDTRK